MSTKSVRNTIENVWNPLGRQRRIPSGGLTSWREPQFWRLPVLVLRNKTLARQRLFEMTRQGRDVEALTMSANQYTVYVGIFELIQLIIKGCSALTPTNTLFKSRPPHFRRSPSLILRT